jgi:sec-independent protein translocase protein TatA
VAVVVPARIKVYAANLFRIICPDGLKPLLVFSKNLPFSAISPAQSPSLSPRTPYTGSGILKGDLMFEGLFQPMHLLVILVVGVVFFGPKKLPELGKGLAEGIRGFKDALKIAQEPPPPVETPKIEA